MCMPADLHLRLLEQSIFSHLFPLTQTAAGGGDAAAGRKQQTAASTVELMEKGQDFSADAETGEASPLHAEELRGAEEYIFSAASSNDSLSPGSHAASSASLLAPGIFLKFKPSTLARSGVRC